MLYVIMRYDLDDKFLESTDLTTGKNITFKEVVNYIYDYYGDKVIFRYAEYSRFLKSVVYHYRSNSFKYSIFIYDK